MKRLAEGLHCLVPGGFKRLFAGMHVEGLMRLPLLVLS
jgi:hypothetical protein